MKGSFTRMAMIVPLLVCFLTSLDVLSADSTPIPKSRRQAARKARPARPKPSAKPAAADAEDRVQAAERRAREAEAAAAKAAADARTAQEQATQAIEAARRANDAVARLQASLDRLEQSSGRTVEDIAALKRADEQSSAEIKAVRTAGEAVVKKVDVVDKRTEGAVTSVSKIPVKLYGNVLVNSNYVDRGANNADVPLFAVKRGTSSDQNHQNFNMTARQSRFGLRYDGMIFSDANLVGVFEFDLLGGKPGFANGEHFDLFRLRLAYGRIDWSKDSFEVGQDWTVFSPLNPTTLASYAIPGFSTSGNLWNRLPQIRYEHREKIGEKGRFVWTSALLDPNAGDHAGTPATRLLGLGERGTMPAIESRIGFSGSTYGKESAVGLSGHYSRLLAVPTNPAGTLFRSPIDSYGISGDLNLWLLSGLRVTGEAFHGRALGIFSGDIAQSAIVDVAGRAHGINSTGGWLEVHGEAPSGYDGPWKKFSLNVGYGIEDARGRDLVTGVRKRNQTYMANGQYKFSPHFSLGLEYRQVQTDWQNQRAVNQKLNWGNLSFLYSF